MIPRIIAGLIFTISVAGCGTENKDHSNLPESGDQIPASIINRSFPADSEKIIIGLLYHRFDESRYPSTSIGSELFEEHLKYLVDNSWAIHTLSEGLSGAYSDTIPERSVVLTIDDAYLSFYNVGYPLLKKYGLKATLFINTETVGSGDYMNWDQLKEVSAYGIEIGNHTHSHDYFLNISDSIRLDIFSNDVQKAQELIGKNLGVYPQVFAYPFGEYDSSMLAFIRQSGFLGAAAQNSGVISKYSDPYALPRFPMTDFYGRMDRFMEKINIKPLPVNEIEPDITIPKSNPPEMLLYLDSNHLDFSRMQCFIQGSECLILSADKDSGIIKVKAQSPLTGRRHLYTITIPDRTGGKWHWFSHQWVFPEKEDK